MIPNPADGCLDGCLEEEAPTQPAAPAPIRTALLERIVTALRTCPHEEGESLWSALRSLQRMPRETRLQCVQVLRDVADAAAGALPAFVGVALPSYTVVGRDQYGQIRRDELPGTPEPFPLPLHPDQFGGSDYP